MEYNRKDSLLLNGNILSSCKIKLFYFLDKNYFVNDCELNEE